MQETKLALMGTHQEFTRSNSNSSDYQRISVACPHCGTQSQAAGKIKESWYVLCRCGTYIQVGAGDDYCD